MSDCWDLSVLKVAEGTSRLGSASAAGGLSEFPSTPARAEALNRVASSASRDWLVFLPESGAATFHEHSAQIAEAVRRQTEHTLLIVPLAVEGLSEGVSPEADARGNLGTRTEIVSLPMSVAGPTGIWKRFPAAVAALIQPPERDSAVIIRRDHLTKEKAPFRDVAAPAWDLVLRLQSRAASVASLEGMWDGSDRAHWPVDVQTLPVLAPKRPEAEQRWLKEAIRACEFPGTKIRSRTEAVALKAGLFQIHDFLDESHAESQSIEGEGTDQSGDYWHGIMHRREPDASNAKYWFRHVGRHPVFSHLAELTGPMLSVAGAENWRGRICGSKGWDPFAFIDLCEECRSKPGHPLEGVTRGIQWVEMLLLLGHTCDDALTST